MPLARPAAVLDACAGVDLLLSTTPRGDSVASALAGVGVIYVPGGHFTAEVLGALRGMQQRGEISDEAFSAAVADLKDLERYEVPLEGLIDDVLPLLESTSVYDAFYVALAAKLGCPLITVDERLARNCSRFVEVADLGLDV